MCRHKVLSKNAYGCIVRHACTGTLHLGFGNVLGVFTEEELKAFRSFCMKLQNNHYDYGIDENQNYYLHTGSKSFVLMLKIHEIKQILQLMDEALLLLEVDKILQNDEK
jgi:hypothetical protein